jgi:hypothetical protein
MLATLLKNVDKKMYTTLQNKLTKNCWQHFQKLLKKYWQHFQEMLTENVGKLPKIVDEKKYWQYFRKMLTTNVGNAPKNVDSTSKNVDEKMFATFPKNVNGKNIDNYSKIN